MKLSHFFNVCLLGLVLALVFTKCNHSNISNEPTDTPTSGEIKMVVDESFQKIFETQLYTFHSIYYNANVKASYLPEKEALQLLSNDSCKVVVMCRDLTAEEEKHFESKNLFPISTKIAEDAIAIIVHPDNTDSIFTVEQIKNMLVGKDSAWKEVSSAQTLGKIQMVFDNNGSANARYMQDTVLSGKSFGKQVFAVKSNIEVMDYVSKNKNAIGFLSVNWISDLDDPKVQTYLTQIKVAAIKKTNDSEAFKPYQAYIKTKEYPFTRSVYMINRQTRTGLGKGIVSFVAGEKGQLMILKSGLVPAIAPVRMVKINMEQ
jgi:phosphate transport system substrate-binding protein